MKWAAAYICAILLSCLTAWPQLKVIRPVKVNSVPSNIGFGMGLAASPVYLARNINDDNMARGLHAMVTYDKGNYIRGMLEYTYYRNINIQPTWKDVVAQAIELNIAGMLKSRDKSIYFYPIAGISYNVFNGYFTGINDYTNLRSIYDKNTNVRTGWLGLNAGCGIDFNFNNGCLYATLLKMRLGRTEGYDEFNIMDVYFDIGLRYYMSTKELGKIFRGTRSRYTLRTKEPSSTQQPDKRRKASGQ